MATRQHWRLAILASMADYFDAGLILATGAAIPIWTEAFDLDSMSLALLATLGPNALSAGAGALWGGWIADKVGRKFVYKYDLLLFAFGILWLIFTTNVWMLFVGSIIVGFAIGVDLPASWALIGESVPKRTRGRFIGLTNVFWAIGPVVTLGLASALAPLGLLGIRIVLAHLLVVSLITWLLRKGMTESAVWRAAHEAPGSARGKRERGANPFRKSALAQLFTGQNLKAFAFLGIVYTLWQLTAGTNGVFLPYILQTFGSQSQGLSVGLQCLGFLLQAISCFAIYMRFGDSIGRWRVLGREFAPRHVIFGVGALLQVVAFLLFAVSPLTVYIALANVILFGFGVGISHPPVCKTLFQEMFPTSIRATAQGAVVALTRIAIGAWYFVLPFFNAMGVEVTATFLVGFLVASSAIGLVWMPNTAGKSLMRVEEH